MSVFCRQVREQDISVDGTCLNGECRNTGAGECFCVGIRSSLGDEADFSGCRGCMNGRIGKVVREGIGEYKGHTAYVEFQNENLTATVDGKILATTPDLISLVDTETYIPVTTDGLKYGKRVMVVGLKCFHLWRTGKGIELVGPRYFGVDTDYIPLEERCKGGN